MYPGAIRTQHYNLVNGTELHDREKDPGESHNIASAHPELLRELRGRYEDRFQTVLAERGFKRFPIPVGYPEENPVTLPAPRAYFSGKIRFNGEFGYSHDWLTGWTNTEDTVWWDVEIIRPGSYLMSLEYVCPENAAGARVSASADSAGVDAPVQKPTSMGPLPDHNIVPIPRNARMEWNTVPLRTARLPQGRTHLELKALAKPGPTMPSVKSVTLFYQDAR